MPSSAHNVRLRQDYLFSSVRAAIVFLFASLYLVSLCRPCDGSHYIKYQMSDYCDGEHPSAPIELSPHGNLSAILIKLKRETYRGNLNCTLTFQAPPHYGLMAFITKLKLRRISASRADTLEFISRNVTLLRMHGTNQEVVPRKTILTGVESNQLEVHFASENSHKMLAGKGFKIIINLYSNVMTNEQCDESLKLDYNCGNDICIDSILECDGINNCRNNLDELECDETSETKLSLYVFLGTLAVMLIMLIMFLMKNKDKRKEIVRRMSRVYANNNPILYVMDTDTDSQSANDSAASLADSRLSSPPPVCQQMSTIMGMSNSPSMGAVASYPESRQQHSGSIRSKLSLSLPQGIDQIRNNVYRDKATNL